MINILLAQLSISHHQLLIKKLPSALLKRAPVSKQRFSCLQTQLFACLQTQLFELRNGAIFERDRKSDRNALSDRTLVEDNTVTQFDWSRAIERFLIWIQTDCINRGAVLRSRHLLFSSSTVKRLLRRYTLAIWVPVDNHRL